MIEGLFWVAVLGGVYFVVDFLTKPAEDTTEDRHDKVMDRTLMSLVLGIVGFFAVVLLFF